MQAGLGNTERKKENAWGVATAKYEINGRGVGNW